MFCRLAQLSVMHLIPSVGLNSILTNVADQNPGPNIFVQIGNRKRSARSGLFTGEPLHIGHSILI